MRLQADAQRTIIPLLSYLIDLVHILGRGRLSDHAPFDGVELVQKRQRLAVDLACHLVEDGGGVGAQLLLEEVVMHILVHDVPVNQLPSISTHHRIQPLVCSCPQLVRRNPCDPSQLHLWAVPQHRVATHRDPMGFRETDQGVRDRVVLDASASLVAVPV